MGKDLKGKDIGKGFSQRKDGRYEARATIKGIKIDIYSKNLAQLKKEFEVEKAKVLRNECNIRPTNITLQEWFDEWFEKYKSPNLKNEVSKNVYKRKINNTYCSIIGCKNLKDISQLNIQTTTNELVQKGYTERTIKEALGALNECINIAILNHIVSVNPCQSIIIKNANQQKEKRVLEQWEQDMFIKEAKNSYYYEAYLILLSTGMRIGEFSGLQWEDVDFENKVIHIRRTLTTGYVNGKKIEQLSSPKTACSYREIPFFGETKQLFTSWKEKQNIYKEQLGDRWRADPKHGNLVFTSTMGSPVSRYVIMHDMKKIISNMRLKEKQNALMEGREPRVIKNIYPHALRHTFATRCFEKKLEPLFIQNIMGHVNYATTISYTHVLDDVRKKEADKVGNFLS